MEGINKKVSPYSDDLQKKRVMKNFMTYEYRLPFNYDNVNVVRRYPGGEKHGMEMNAVNSYHPEPERRPSDYIEIIEEEPIVRVEVIGSACNPPGYIQLMAEPIKGFRRDDEPTEIMPVRFRIDNLWGMHLRADQWLVRDIDVPRWDDCPLANEPYQKIPEKLAEQVPVLKGVKAKTDYREFPQTGMSCALFSIPMSHKIKITGGCEIPGWVDDNFPDDVHYSFRLIRVTVCDVVEG